MQRRLAEAVAHVGVEAMLEQQLQARERPAYDCGVQWRVPIMVAVLKVRGVLLLLLRMLEHELQAAWVTAECCDVQWALHRVVGCANVTLPSAEQIANNLVVTPEERTVERGAPFVVLDQRRGSQAQQAPRVFAVAFDCCKQWASNGWASRSNEAS